ncbi:putative 26S proteasome complex subunit sem1-1 [Heracleum sosnowskyi]|uniref:26S proteasome complex subunit SEM1 n=1 Tax=Heracleum sosnowskyi TaxID=360622 RepID=A0AAD8H4W3_9APIA|nr:putative 26S proteasome complex subunit sem1-1 [Heracleum sosnowskyi]
MLWICYNEVFKTCRELRALIIIAEKAQRTDGLGSRLLQFSSGTNFVQKWLLMADTKPQEKVEEVAKIDLFEDDDEFEEFEIGQEFDEKKEVGIDVTQQWEDDWDDDDVNDDFSLQLRRELVNNSTRKI